MVLDSVIMRDWIIIFLFFFQLRLINSRLINSIISAERCVEKLRKEDFFFYFCFIYVAREVVKGQGF